MLSVRQSFFGGTGVQVFFPADEKALLAKGSILHAPDVGHEVVEFLLHLRRAVLAGAFVSRLKSPSLAPIPEQQSSSSNELLHSIVEQEFSPIG